MCGLNFVSLFLIRGFNWILICGGGRASSGHIQLGNIPLKEAHIRKKGARTLIVKADDS